MIALPSLLAGVERRCHRLRGEHGGSLVTYDGSDHLRTVRYRLRLDIGKARQALNDRIIDALLHIRAGLADAADRDIDQARMALAQLIDAKAEALHGAGPEILHHDVRLRDQPGENLTAGRAFDVNRQRTLAAVRRDEQRGELAVLVDRGTAAPGDVAADRLDLQNVGALIRQKHGRERTRHHAGQIEDTNTAKRTGHGILPEFSSVEGPTTNLLSSRSPGSACLARPQFPILRRFWNGLAGLFDNRFLDIAELVLAEEHFLSNEESR